MNFVHISILSYLIYCYYVVTWFQLHRRLLYDDSQGVSEPLDENQYGVGMVSRGKHVLHFNELDKAAKAHRLSALNAAMQPVVTFAPTHMASSEWGSKFSATVRPSVFYRTRQSKLFPVPTHRVFYFVLLLSIKQKIKFVNNHNS